MNEALHELLLRELRAVADNRIACGVPPGAVLADLRRRLLLVGELQVDHGLGGCGRDDSE